MADQERPRIHPAVDVEEPPPTTPLVPRGSSASEKSPESLPVIHRPPAAPLLPRGSSAPEKSPVPEGPPLGRLIPAIQRPTPPLVPRGSLASNKIPVPQQSQLGHAIHASPPVPAQKRSCWCKCICWTIGLLVLLLIAVGVAALVIYLVFKPKVPSYSVDSLRISDLRLNFDLSLYARFDVKITTYNPNKKIGIHYEKGGMLSVWYTKTKLCEGSLPDFYQGHQNKTVLNTALTGQNQYGNALMSALQEQQQTGRIPLDLKVRAPVSIELGRLKLRKVKVLGSCLLVVDSLSTNNIVSIKASNCKFRLKL